MNLLDANDRFGHYPPSVYADVTPELPPFAPLDGDIRADVCVIGGGYTGLHTALRLREAGLDVVLIEAQRVGFGASGRNGGQVGSGQRQNQLWLEARFGKDAAGRFWDLGEAAKALVRTSIATHGIDCDLAPGVAQAATGAGSFRELAEYARHLAETHDYTQIDILDPAAFSEVVKSPGYAGGIIDRGAGHLNPLAYALGLARAAALAGARIFERTRATELGPGPSVLTVKGTVTADHVVLSCNGYLGNLAPEPARHVMPINNFVAATEPLGDRLNEVLADPIAVADDRFVVNYYRPSKDGRLVFGGGESYGYKFPADIAATVRKPLERTFPQLAGVRLTHAWGGTLAITLSRMPFLARLSPGVWSASGYSGHGVAMAGQAGRTVAEAILGDAERFDLFSSAAPPAFPGGRALRAPLLVLAMTWYSLRDRLGF
ncbi:MAG: FAD-binding oxidoreductase [Pseudomonadota bacterium]